jgi:SAM-dependent methyltransferase
VISIDGALTGRDLFHGVRQVVRFNWPYYLIAAPAAILGSTLALRLPVSSHGRMLSCLAVAPILWWIAASLVVSWVVYDRSPLMGTEWTVGLLGYSPARWINIHAGFDEMTPLLGARFGASCGTSFDIFDPMLMTEASIAKARRYSGHASESAGESIASAPAASADAVFLHMSAHELRSDAARIAHFGEVRRILAPTGRVVVVEHLRNLPNFAAFGPGFLHFHSRRTWMRDFAAAGLAVQIEKPITPFVRVFVLRRAV